MSTNILSIIINILVCVIIFIDAFNIIVKIKVVVLDGVLDIVYVKINSQKEKSLHLDYIL
jgi:hypothetical protein